MTAPADNTFMKITCLPVICKRVAAGPVNALTILAEQRMIKQKIPFLKSSPNAEKTCVEKLKKTTNNGAVLQNINLVD